MEKSTLPASCLVLCGPVASRDHLKNVFDDHELEEKSVIRNFRITATDGKTYDTHHYSLYPIAITAEAFACTIAAGSTWLPGTADIQTLQMPPTQSASGRL